MSLRYYYTTVSYNMYKRIQEASLIMQDGIRGYRSVLSTTGRVLDGYGRISGTAGGINGYRRDPRD